jgi:hypothetical protein
MARLGPRIGKKHEGARQRLCRQRRHDEAGIVGEQPHVGDARPLDMRQALRDAVDKGLAADQADGRMMLGLPHQMLAGAEAHFEPNAFGRQRAAEEAREIDLRRALGNIGLGRDDRFGGQVEGEARQQRVEQRLLPGTQLLAPATTMQRTSAGFFHGIFRAVLT